MITFTKWVFNNKAALMILVVLTLVMGVLAYTSLPKEIMPGVDIPQVTVTVMAQGYDANSLVTQVTEPIEQSLSSVKGKEKIYSETNDGYVRLNVSFNAKTDMKEAKTDVQEALSNVHLPDGVAKPYVFQMNLSNIPVADIGMSFNDGWTKENLDTLDKDILPVFQKIDGVSNVTVYGRSTSQVVIKADKDKLEKAKIPVQMLAGVLQGKNLSVALGDSTLDGEATTLKVVGKLDSIAQLEDMQLAPQVKLKDVATVSQKTDGQSITRVNGKDSTVLILFKNLDANAVKVGEDAKKAVDQINADFGSKVKANLLMATSDFVVTSVDSMMREVLLGALFATIVILIFLRNVRMTLITIVSIPLSMAITLTLLQKAGITLNMLTLGAVAVSVGRLVDDSIVVIENIYRRLGLGQNSKELIIDATKEVATAITSSTITTVAVFLPMGLVSGTLSKMVLPFALTMTFSLLASLLVALTVIPVMSASLLKNAKVAEHKPAKRFSRFLEWNLNRKWLPLTVAIVALVGSVSAFAALPQGSVDAQDKRMASITLNYPSSTPYAKVRENAEKLDAFIKDQSEVENSWLMLGNSDDAAKFGEVNAPTLAQFGAVLKEGSNADHFVEQVKAQKSAYEGADLTVASQDFTGGGGSTITLDLLNGKYDDLVAASKQVMDTVKAVDGVEKVESNQKEVKPSYEIVMNDNAPMTATEVSQQLHMLTMSMPIGQMKVDDKDTAVLLDSGYAPASIDELNKLTIMTKTGPVALNTLAKLEKTEKPSTVLRQDSHEYLRVTATVDPKQLSTIAAKISAEVKKLSLPKGVEVKTGGSAADMAGDMSSLAQTMLASIGLVYLILVITFKTLRTPFAILFTLPLAAIGAVAALMISRITVDTTAAIGALMLIGIVVTNAIVLLDRVKQNEKTMTIREALLEATATRMRPILMTAIATICAMLPLLFGKDEAGALVGKGLALVVIGGLAVATVLTLVIIPVIYELLHFRKAKKQRVAKKASVPANA